MTSRFLPLRRFGNTGLQVTAVAAGLAPLGSMPETFGYEVSVDRAVETLHAIFRSPINFLDTSAAYGDGESERRIGMVLKEYGGVPTGYVIATKVDRNLQTGDFSGDQIRRSLERSLRLLGLDRFPLVYLHDPEHTTFENVMSKGGPLEVLRRFKEEGVIAHLGVAGGPIDMMIRYVETGAFEAVITHNRYTLLNRVAEPLIQIAHRQGLAVVNAAPFGGGILARGPRQYPRYSYMPASHDLLDRATRMETICRQAGVPLGAAAVQFSMRDPRIASTIAGVSRAEHVQQLVEFATHPIPEQTWAALEAVGTVGGDPEAGRWG